MGFQRRLLVMGSIAVRHIDKRLRDYWLAQGLIEISGVWPFQKARLTAKGLEEGLPTPVDSLSDLMWPRGQ
jgi:hypothetical protein